MNLRCVSRCAFMFAGGWASLLLMIMLTGCATVQPAKQIVFERWAGAYRLTNGTVQATVVPQVGRVAGFSMVDGSGEVLWWNHAPDAKAQWPNWGGDKAWPWSQDDWKGVWAKINWPPPAAFDGKPYTVTYSDVRRLRMISSVDEKQGLQLEYEITLDETGHGATVRYTLIRAQQADGPAWGAWSVTQVRMPEVVLARMPDGSQPQVQNMSAGKDWQAVLQVSENVLQFVRDPATHAKVGVDADRLLAVRGDWGLMITVQPGTTTGEYVATEKAQLYVTPDARDMSQGDPRYLELEFTSPRQPLAKVGDRVTLVTRWELLNKPKATLSDWVTQAGER